MVYICVESRVADPVGVDPDSTFFRNPTLLEIWIHNRPKLLDPDNNEYDLSHRVRIMISTEK